MICMYFTHCTHIIYIYVLAFDVELFNWFCIGSGRDLYTPRTPTRAVQQPMKIKFTKITIKMPYTFYYCHFSNHHNKVKYVYVKLYNYAHVWSSTVLRIFIFSFPNHPTLSPLTSSCSNKSIINTEWFTKHAHHSFLIQSI